MSVPNKNETSVLLKEGAQHLDAKHPTVTTIKRSVARVLKDLSALKKSSSVRKIGSVFIRLGSMLGSDTYRSAMAVALIAGGYVNVVGGAVQITAILGIFSGHRILANLQMLIHGLILSAVGKIVYTHARNVRSTKINTKKPRSSSTKPKRKSKGVFPK